MPSDDKPRPGQFISHRPGMDQTNAPVSSHQLSVRYIRDPEGLRSLREPWNSLADRQADPSVFYRHEWFDAAFGWRRRDSELFLITVFDGDELLGLCPLVRTERPVGPVRIRFLEFLTVPDTQFCDILVVPERRNEILAVIARSIAACRREWDMMVLSYLKPDSATCQEFLSCLNSQSIQGDVKSRHCAVDINLSGDWNTYYSTRSRRLKKSSNHIRNKLKESGQISLKWYSPDDTSPDDIENLLSIITRISSKSWKCQTGKSLDNTAPADFIHILTRHAVYNNWLSVWLLCLDERPIAMEYQLAYNDHIYALRADFDEEMEHLSPGSYLNKVIIERLFDTNYHVYHMGPGANEYKLKWSNSQTNLCSLTGYSNSIIARISLLYRHKLHPLLKRIYRHFKSMKTGIAN